MARYTKPAVIVHDHQPVVIYRSGRPVAHSRNLGALVHYARHKSDLICFWITERQSVGASIANGFGTVTVKGYSVVFSYEDGARADVLFKDWRVALRFIAKAARPAKGAFCRVQPHGGLCPEWAADAFYRLTDLGSHPKSVVLEGEDA